MKGQVPGKGTMVRCVFSFNKPVTGAHSVNSISGSGPVGNTVEHSLLAYRELSLLLRTHHSSTGCQLTDS